MDNKEVYNYLRELKASLALADTKLWEIGNLLDSLVDRCLDIESGWNRSTTLTDDINNQRGEE